MNQNEVAAIEKISTMLSCVCNAIGNAQAEQTAALERIAAALERAHPKQLVDDTADAGDDYAELDIETHEDEAAGRTDHYTMLLEDGMRATVTTWEEDGLTGFYVGFPDDDLFASNPTALHDLADRFRSYAKAFDHVATLWDADRRTGVIPTVESVR